MSIHNICFYEKKRNKYPTTIIKYSSSTSPMNQRLKGTVMYLFALEQQK